MKDVRTSVSLVGKGPGETPLAACWAQGRSERAARCWHVDTCVGSHGCLLPGTGRPVMMGVLVLHVTPAPFSSRCLILGPEGPLRMWGSCPAFLGAGGQVWMQPSPRPHISGLYS